MTADNIVFDKKHKTLACRAHHAHHTRTGIRERVYTHIEHQSWVYTGPSQLILSPLFVAYSFLFRRVECVSFRLCDYTAIVCRRQITKGRRACCCCMTPSFCSPADNGQQWGPWWGPDFSFSGWSNIINESERTPCQCSVYTGPRSNNVNQQMKLCVCGVQFIPTNVTQPARPLSSRL